MKRGIYLAMAVVMACSFTACGSKKETKDSTVSAKALGEVDGSLKSYTDGILVVDTNDKEELSFKITSKTQMNCKNMLAGDNVTVMYEGKLKGTDTDQAVVTSVDDKGKSTQTVKQQEMVGTLEEYTSTSLKLKSNDGKEYQFSIVGAAREYKNGIEPGNWIHIYYTGNINDTNTSAVKVVKIIDDSDNIKNEQAKVQVKDVNENVWATAVVNVRDNYSTNANVLGTLQANDEVVRTGNCDNGWSRITYNGNTAYVYGAYVTTTAPAAPTQPAPAAEVPQPSQPKQPAAATPQTSQPAATDNGGSTGDSGNTDDGTATTPDEIKSTTGYVISLATDGTLMIDVDEQDYTFNITNAQQNYANGLLVGNEVTITFQGDLDDSANAVVYTVTDSAANTNNQSQITGTVKTASMNCIVIATDDNAILSISTGDAEVNVTGGITEGVRVTATLDLTQTVDESNVFYASAVNDAVN